MVTLFAEPYFGLKPKGSYEELIERLASGRDKLVAPDRQAKFLRESPQIANLLDGEGSLNFVELGRQQVAAAAHTMVEQRIREAAAVPGAPPAQVLRAAQTRSPPGPSSIASEDSFVTGAGPSPPRSAASRTAPQAAEMFDLTADDKMDDDLAELNRSLDDVTTAMDQQQARVAEIIARHLGEEVQPSHPFAHQAATSSAAAAEMTPAQQEFSDRLTAQAAASQAVPMEDYRPPTKRAGTSPSKSPESTANPASRGKKGRKGKTLEDEFQDLMTDVEASRPMPKSPAKPKKQGKTLEDEFQDLMADIENAAAQRAPKPKAPQGKASSSSKGPETTEAAPEVTGQSSSSSARRDPHGLEKIEGKSRAWWGRQNITVIKAQAELRGHRFTERETKGETIIKGGKSIKQPRMLKKDYLAVLYRLLGI